MKKIILIQCAVLLFSCDGSKKAAVIDSRAPAENSEVAEPLYEILTASEYGGKEAKSFEVVKDQSGLAKLYESIGNSEIPKIDFSKQRLVALFLGQKSSGGYAVKVKSLYDSGDKIVVAVHEASPQPGQNVTTALTNPYAIVKINSVKEIVFQ